MSVQETLARSSAIALALQRVVSGLRTCSEASEDPRWHTRVFLVAAWGSGLGCGQVFAALVEHSCAEFLDLRRIEERRWQRLDQQNTKAQENR